MKKFKRVSMIFMIILLVVLISGLLVSLIVANIHKVSLITEWRSWGKAMKIIKSSSAANISFVRRK